MKTTLQLLILFLFASTLSAQNNITVKINHLLEGEEFEYDVNSKNDLENDFKLDRLEYYISNFKITHDGGQEIIIDDLYVLVSLTSKAAPTEIDLGEFDVDEVEKVSFFFGIDEEANHADPALWPEGHALAPKFPSMHWGWAAGYRFIALEGLSGPATNQMMQFHCIGDEFFEELEFVVTSSEENTQMVEINAEYTNLLSQIDVSSGLILHGNLGHIKTLANNLKGKVFTSAEVTSVEDNEVVQSFNVYPNPSTNGLFSLDLETSNGSNTLLINDAFGRTIENTSISKKNLTINKSGLYFVSLLGNNGEILATRKVIVL